MSNREVVQRVYEAFVNREVETVLAFLTRWSVGTA